MYEKCALIFFIFLVIQNFLIFGKNGLVYFCHCLDDINLEKSNGMIGNTIGLPVTELNNECENETELNVIKGLKDTSWSQNVPMMSRGCPAEHSLPCVPKCCDIYESYNLGKQCATSKDYFIPTFQDRPNVSEYFKDVPIEDRYEYFIGDPCSSGKYILDTVEYPEDEYNLYSNGTLWYGGRHLTMNEFCVESVNGTLRIFVCFEGTPPGDYKFLLYPVGLLISIPLLLLTAFVYLGIKKLRDVQGAALACHVLCLAVAYFFLSLVQLASQELHGDVCIAAAFIIQFFFVACFFWLNILSFDIWKNIRTNSRMSGREKKRWPEKKTFICYSLYAWYGPCMLTIVSLIMDLEPTIPESLLKPKFGKKSCWFQSDDAALPYFYGPVGVIILINIIFFIMSAKRIHSEQRQYVKLKRTNQTRDKNTKLQKYIRSLKQCISLFCVMGINWAAEVISWMIGGSDLIWMVTDIFNTFQGLIIFYIFVIKPKQAREEFIKKLHSCFCGSKCCRNKTCDKLYEKQYSHTEDENVEEGEEMAYFHPQETFPFIDSKMDGLNQGSGNESNLWKAPTIT